MLGPFAHTRELVESWSPTRLPRMIYQRELSREECVMMLQWSFCIVHTINFQRSRKSVWAEDERDPMEVTLWKEACIRQV
eukprot:5552171-Amphidinium_carterae.1